MIEILAPYAGTRETQSIHKVLCVLQKCYIIVILNNF